VQKICGRGDSVTSPARQRKRVPVELAPQDRCRRGVTRRALSFVVATQGRRWPISTPKRQGSPCPSITCPHAPVPAAGLLQELLQKPRQSTLWPTLQHVELNHLTHAKRTTAINASLYLTTACGTPDNRAQSNGRPLLWEGCFAGRRISRFRLYFALLTPRQTGRGPMPLSARLLREMTESKPQQLRPSFYSLRARPHAAGSLAQDAAPVVLSQRTWRGALERIQVQAYIGRRLNRSRDEVARREHLCPVQESDDRGRPPGTARRTPDTADAASLAKQAAIDYRRASNDASEHAGGPRASRGWAQRGSRRALRPSSAARSTNHVSFASSRLGISVWRASLTRPSVLLPARSGPVSGRRLCRSGVDRASPTHAHRPVVSAPVSTPPARV
jgi:hypothetical protein